MSMLQVNVRVKFHECVRTWEGRRILTPTEMPSTCNAELDSNDVQASILL